MKLEKKWGVLGLRDLVRIWILFFRFIERFSLGSFGLMEVVYFRGGKDMIRD